MIKNKPSLQSPHQAKWINFCSKEITQRGHQNISKYSPILRNGSSTGHWSQYYCTSSHQGNMEPSMNWGSKDPMPALSVPNQAAMGSRLGLLWSKIKEWKEKLHWKFSSHPTMQAYSTSIPFTNLCSRRLTSAEQPSTVPHPSFSLCMQRSVVSEKFVFNSGISPHTEGKDVFI